MQKLLGLLIVGALLSFGRLASAGPLEDGVAAAKRGDHALALKLWRPIAELGDEYAQYNLGLTYEHGRGVRQDYREAMKWYRLAADQGHELAQYNLGVMYATGRGAPQNDKEAVMWFRLAAIGDVAGAQNNLGFMYANGRGVPQDYVRGHMWFNLAAASSSGGDAKNATDSRNSLAAKMTPAQIERAHEMARKCQQSNFRDCGW